MRQLLFSQHPQFWFETLRVFSHATYGGSDFGEVLATAERVEPGNNDSWYDGWLATADRIASEAENSRERGHLISARDGYLRASTYYRTADFFLHANPEDPRVDNAYRRGTACFHAVVDLSAESVERMLIPFEGTYLQGYLYRPAGPVQPRPTLLLHNGFDGGAEELHFLGAVAAAERGYNAVTFDGPGQPSALRESGLVFRPDWENVVGPVLNHLEDQYAADVDSERIGLLGVSLGGMLAPRAAAFDKRVSALIAVDGIYDATTAITSLLGIDRADLVHRLAEQDPTLGPLLDKQAQGNPTLQWILDHGRYSFGARDAVDFLLKHLQYNLSGGIAEQITCPTLICSAEHDLFYGAPNGQLPEPKQLQQHLNCPTTLLEFTAEEGADAHCHAGAVRLAMARILDWLSETLRTGVLVDRM